MPSFLRSRNVEKERKIRRWEGLKVVGEIYAVGTRDERGFRKDLFHRMRQEVRKSTKIFKIRLNYCLNTLSLLSTTI